jgi:hypothetical protein
MDKTLYGQVDNSGEYVPLLAHDNGDGTYSIVTYGGSGSSGGLTNTELRATPVPVSIPASELHLGMVSGQGISVHAEFTRPADTTAYTTKDVVAPAVTSLIPFSGIARTTGGSFYVVKARLLTNLSTNTASYRLHLYNSASISGITADNTPFAMLWSNRANRVGYVDFDSTGVEGTGSDCAYSLNKDIRLHIKCDAGSRDIYGALEITAAQTPASGQQFFISLNVEQD